MLPLLNLVSDKLRALPLVVLYITDGCNSRCVTCDIWKLPRRNMSMELVDQLAAEFPALGVKQVILSGGEAMQHPRWQEIAAKFRAVGTKVMLLTNGLFLKKQAQQVIDFVDALTVSLDGGTAQTYQAIRGVDAFDVILEGVSLIAAGGVPITTRTTVQRRNFRELPLIIDAAKAAGVGKISFLAVDTSNHEAFGPRFNDGSSIPLISVPDYALTADDLPAFAAILERLERDYAADFASGRMAESPQKLRRLYDYFAAPFEQATFVPPRCNAPHISTVIEVDGTIRPCFFLPASGKLGAEGLKAGINAAEAVDLRRAYRSGERSECARCVCPLYRGPRSLLGIS
ncbi:MAG: radical SAM protein [Anaerolineae bacterium]|nr:radical SAM protein [Anaerolineae bacterium]